MSNKTKIYTQYIDQKLNRKEHVATFYKATLFQRCSPHGNCSTAITFRNCHFDNGCRFIDCSHFSFINCRVHVDNFERCDRFKIHDSKIIYGAKYERLEKAPKDLQVPVVGLIKFWGDGLAIKEIFARWENGEIIGNLFVSEDEENCERINKCLDAENKDNRK